MKFLILFMMISQCWSAGNQKSVALPKAPLEMGKMLLSPNENNIVDICFYLFKKMHEWKKIIEAENMNNSLDSIFEEVNLPVPDGSYTHPFRYGPKELLLLYRETINYAAPIYQSVLLNPGSVLPVEYPLGKEYFESLYQSIHYLYLTAIRWKRALTEMDFYRSEAKKDIRGFIFFLESYYSGKINKWVNHFPNFKSQTYKEIKRHLEILCNNYSSIYEQELDCEKQTEFENADDFLVLLDSYYQEGKINYLRFFNLNVLPPGISYREGILHIRVNPLAHQKLAQFFKQTIEDNWKGDDFRIKIHFDQAPDIPQLVVRENVINHVERKNNIPMIFLNSTFDINSEYAKKVLIHEFGHVLGFPDCYLEFKEMDANALTVYSIEEDNIMCSIDKGVVLPKHIVQLKRLLNIQ